MKRYYKFEAYAPFYNRLGISSTSDGSGVQTQTSGGNTKIRWGISELGFRTIKTNISSGTLVEIFLSITINGTRDNFFATPSQIKIYSSSDGINYNEEGSMYYNTDYTYLGDGNNTESLFIQYNDNVWSAHNVNT